MKTEAEIRVMLPQAKEHREPPEAGRGKEGVSPKSSGGSPAWLTPWFWTSGLKLQENKFLLS